MASVFQHFLAPRYSFPIVQNTSKINAKFANESNHETDKVEGFADDTTTTIACCENSVQNLKKILEQFSIISGLHCNIDKTTPTPVGKLDADNSSWLASSGFTICNSFKLLGMNIDSEAEKLTDNFDAVISKMLSSVAF